MEHHVLLLDHTYMPYQIIDWKRAMVLLTSDRAKVLEWSDNFVSSPSKKWELPSVMVLEKTKLGSSKSRRVPLTRRNLALRDGYKCQYCGVKAHKGHVNFEVDDEMLRESPIHIRDFTMDHVHPKSEGGPTTWDNIVLSCQACNHKKGSKSLDALGWKLKKDPYRPDRSTLVRLYVQNFHKSGLFPESWLTWIGV